MVMVSRSWYSLVLQGIVWYCMVWRSWKVMVSRSWTASALQDFLDSLMALWAFGVQNLSIDGEKNTTTYLHFFQLYIGQIQHMEPIQIFFFITCQSQDKKDRGESECHWSPRWQILAPQPPLSALIGDLYYFPLKKHCPENVLEYIENILKNIEIY